MSVPKRHVMVVFGTRPEAIKMAPVIRELRSRPGAFRTTVCVTAQHRRMLDQVLEVFDICPEHDLDIMKRNQDLAELASRVLKGVAGVIAADRPDILVVQGDTVTTMAAALAAFYARVKVAHVEAGLRTGNKSAPFPEEMNRIITTRIADLHFAPTERARDNLQSEGIRPDAILVTGNTGIDALELAMAAIRRDAALREGITQSFSFLDPEKKMILVTGHRREKFGSGLENICQGIAELSKRHPDIEIVYPVHPNPNVWAPAFKLLGGRPFIHLIKPLDYFPFVYLMDRAYFILTDSGGIQEEAPTLGKPVLVMRDVTERPEAVEAGTVRLVGTNPDDIVKEADVLLTDNCTWETMSRAHNPYGDGHAAERIAAALASI